MEKEYKLGNGHITFMYLFGAFGLIMSLRGFYLFTRYDQAEWLLVSVVPLLVATIVFPLITTKKVVINTTHIKRYNVLTTRELLIADITGYRLRHIPNTRHKKLMLESGNGEILDIRYYQLNHGDEILDWAEHHFRNLDE